MKRQIPAIVFASAFLIHPSSFSDDATFKAPKEQPEKEIPIIEPTPPKEDSLDRFKKLLPKWEPREKPPESVEEEAEYEVLSPAGRLLYQLKDYNWQQNVNIRIGHFTILGYRDVTSDDRMLFRFLTPEEHHERKVMNSKASLIGRKPMDTRPPLPQARE